MARKQIGMHVEALCLVALGGILGSNLRFLLGAVAGAALLETLLINALGSFALGLLLFDARADNLLSNRLRYVFGTGFLASFTSYSTFVSDIAFSGPSVAVAYICGSYAAAFGGILLSRRVVASRASTQIQPQLPGDD